MSPQREKLIMPTKNSQETPKIRKNGKKRKNVDVDLSLLTSFGDSTNSESSGICSLPVSTQNSVTTFEGAPPIITHFNHQVRPLLDAIDRLRLLNVMQEGIQLPTIVVVGDQSSGKSSVLESLAAISLPRNVGICTRVPLIMRLQNHQSSVPEIYLEYSGKTVPVEEANITAAINLATDEIAGAGKGISNTPLTLVIKRDNVPDLTMVDLPGITRVPVRGQPDNIYEQIRDIIMEYITPEESIILNVLSATVDFSTCESIRMSQMVDKSGDRTIAVVTKADLSPQELPSKVNNDDVNIGLGYVCVRNRMNLETYEEARLEEAKLFETDPHLSKIDKSIVGIPVLAQKLVEIQERIIAKCLPDILKKIKSKLSANLSALEKMPKAFLSIADVMTAILRIIGASKDSLKKLLLSGEFDEFPNDPTMHGTARLVEMLNQFSNELQANEKACLTKDFLSEEIKVLEEGKGIGLPNFLPRSAFLRILQRKVDGISHMPIKLAEKLWEYIDKVVTLVLTHHSEQYYQFKASARTAAHNAVKNMQEQSLIRVEEIVRMEKLTDYTCDPDYVKRCTELMSEQERFINVVNSDCTDQVVLEYFGSVPILHLHSLGMGLENNVLRQAFDLKIRMTAYWEIVVKRLIDCMALHLQYSIHQLLNNDIEQIMNEVMGLDGQGIARMLVENPVMAAKRQKLQKSIKLLKQSEKVVSTIMDKIDCYNSF